MSIIDFEIEEVRKLCENVVPNSKIITCTAVPPALVRVDINDDESITITAKDCIEKQTKQYRSLTALLRFPLEYPKQVLLVELKSRTLSDKFLEALTIIAEKKAAEQLGKPQVLLVLRFLQQYIKENPLCVCFDEIQQLRRALNVNVKDELKLKQKKSNVKLCANGGNYFYNVEVIIPANYPEQCAHLLDAQSNLPAVLQNYLTGQSREIARRCVEPPLALANNKQALANFQAVPSLYKALKFVIDATRDFHEELCPVCERTVLPEDPKNVEENNTKKAFIERVYCGHLFHQGCLKHFMEQPPFPKGGKLCPAKQRHLRSDAKDYVGVLIKNTVEQGFCGIRLSHDRWVINPRLAEARWSHKQARARELKDVEDFWN